LELEETAARLIQAIHLSMDWSVWGEKRLKYWGILTDNVRSAAYTNSLSRFVNSLCSKMQVPVLGTNKAQRSQIETLLNSLSPAEERQLLRLFRDEATTLVLQVRVWSEERKARWAERAAAEMDDWDDSQVPDDAFWQEGESNGLPV